jgi:hypothetical protein
MACHPLLTVDHRGIYVAWCKPCGFEAARLRRNEALAALIAHRKASARTPPAIPAAPGQRSLWETGDQ